MLNNQIRDHLKELPRRRHALQGLADAAGSWQLARAPVCPSAAPDFLRKAWLPTQPELSGLDQTHQFLLWQNYSRSAPTHPSLILSVMRLRIKILTPPGPPDLGRRILSAPGDIAQATALHIVFSVKSCLGVSRVNGASRSSFFLFAGFLLIGDIAFLWLRERTVSEAKQGEWWGAGIFASCRRI